MIDDDKNPAPSPNDPRRLEGHIAASDDPRWNQSFYFNFYDETHKIGGFIRVGIMENAKTSNNWFVIFKDGRPLFNRINMHLPYSDGRLDTEIAVAGIRMKSIEPLQIAQVSFDEAEFKLDLKWEGITPMQDAIALTSDQDGSFSRELAHAHLEQVCRVTGTIATRDGASYDISAKGFRDLSVGPRNYDVMSNHRLMWPAFDNGVAIVAVRGFPVSGGEAFMRMLFNGQQWIAVTNIEDETRFGSDGVTVETADWTVTDANGRQWRFTARNLFRCFFPFDTYLVTGQFMEFTLDDGTVGYGLCECGFRLPWAI